MKLKIILICVVFLCISCIKTGNLPEKLDPMKSKSNFGIDLSLSPDDDSFPHWDHDTIVKRVSDMNIKWTRETVMQSGVEYPKGVYHWESHDRIIKKWQQHNIHLLVAIFGSTNFEPPVINNKEFDGVDDENTTSIRNPGYKLVPTNNGYGNAKSTLDEWTSFVEHVVERYDGDGYKDMPGLKYPIKYWESWNEPNYWSEWGGFWNVKWPDSTNTEDIRFLKKLHKSFYKAVKRADPEALVVGPSVLTRSSYETDHRKEFYCAEDMYEYFDFVNYHRNHRYSWVDWDSSTICVKDKPIWVTEFNRHKKSGETVHQNNIELIKLFIQGGYCTQNRLHRAYHYFEQADQNMYFDLTQPGYPLKELGRYVKLIFTLLDESEPVEFDKNSNSVHYTFVKEDSVIHVLWSDINETTVNISTERNSIELIRLDGIRRRMELQDKSLELELTNEPIFVVEKIIK